MRKPNSCCLRLIDLRARFGLHVVHLGMCVDVFSQQWQITHIVEQARNLTAAPKQAATDT